MSLESYLDDREDRRERDEAEDRKLQALWSLASANPAERLMAFDHWVKAQLQKRLVWPPSPDIGTDRRIHQCRVELEHMLTQLFSRGWLLDGQRIARHVTTVLDAVGAAQRKGAVKDFWPYFKASVNRYVGANAEELQVESKRAGNVMNNVLASLGVKPETGSIVELVATRRSEINQDKSLRAQLSAQKRASKARADALQLDFTTPAEGQNISKPLAK